MIKHYKNTTDTNIDWLGHVPNKWLVVKLKYALSNVPYPIVDGPFGTQLKAEEYTEKGVPLVRISNLDFKGNLTLEDIKFISEEKALELQRSKINLNDVIIGKTGATIGKSGLNDKIEYGIISSSCLKISVDQSKIFPQYFKYYVTSANFQSIIIQTASGSTRDTINITPMANLEVLIPSLQEQTQIAQYLDYQTRIIDELIKKKEKLIELLKEKRQAIINEAVTKGLNPKAKMKDSGIEWLGEVPEEWEIRNLEVVAKKNRYSITGGPFGSDLKNEEYTEQGVRIIQLQNIGVGEFLDEYKIYTSEEKANYLFSSNIYPGEIIIAKMADPVARACIIPNIAERFIMASDGIRLEVNNEKYNTKFIEYAINANYFNYQAELNSTGTTRLRIGLTTLKKLKVLLPRLIEQNLIIEYLESYNHTFLNSLQQLSSQIEKLKEYRQSIISEAVTGKIDVRDWQPNKK